MIAEAELQEYLEEIRREVCGRCVERPPGGPPCGPLGKVCGVELHLPQLVEAVRGVHSEWMGPYLDSTHEKVCAGCPHLHADCCPCPMDSLALLVVEAIEAVDERRQRRQKGRRLIEGLPAGGPPGMEEITGAYEDAVGTWVECDWPTAFGPGWLDLNGCSAAGAEARAVEAAGTPEAEFWSAAAGWLREVERRAKQAEARAALAVVAANAGEWREAVEHARQAWDLEVDTGRPLRRFKPTWLRLCEVIEAAQQAACPPGGVL